MAKASLYRNFSMVCCCRRTIASNNLIPVNVLPRWHYISKKLNVSSFFIPFTYLHSDITLYNSNRDTSSNFPDDISEDFLSFLTNDFRLDRNKIEVIFKKCPNLFRKNLAQLRANAHHISDIGLTLSNMRKMILRTPDILLVDPEHISRISNLLVEDLGFTSRELNKLIVGSAQIFLGSVSELERKYDFLHFTLGYRDHVDIVKYNVMKYPLSHLRTRYEFLNRRRQYIIPDRHGNTKIENPSLEKIFCVNDDVFCEEVASCMKWEFDIFVKLFREELKSENKLENEENSTHDESEIFLNDHHEKEDEKSFADSLLKQL